MFAVLKTGGKQYRVSVGEELVVDRLDAGVGEKLNLPAAFSGEGESFEFSERSVEVEVLEHFKGEKLYVYKYKPKKDSRKKTGHRQQKTRIKVLEVS
jgi:large subunit ribosomal protein L21